MAVIDLLLERVKLELHLNNDIGKMSLNISEIFLNKKKKNGINIFTKKNENN